MQYRTISLWLFLLALAVETLALSSSISSAFNQRDSAGSEQRQKWVEAYGRLPLTFEANRGQVDSTVDFLARTSGYTFFTKASEAVLAIRSATRTEPKVVRMKLVGANAEATATGMEEQPGRVSYFIGSDPEKWHENVPTFGKVRYPAIYPGIDLIYYGNQQQLEYDFAVAPGATPETIALQFSGDVQSVREDSVGNLEIFTPAGSVRLQRPQTYQDLPTGHREIWSKYVVEKQSVHFQVGSYDKAQPLIIDPVLVYSTYLGGSTNEAGYGIAVDASGNAFIAGQSNSVDFPGGGNSVAGAFLVKLNPSGSALLYSAFFGGNSASEAMGVALDASGNAYIAGDTQATNFPVTGGAFQPSTGGSSDAFVTKIAFPSGTLAYSSYIGGSSSEFGTGLAVDASGSAVIVGNTMSINFPTASPIQAARNGPMDAFVTRLKPDGTVLYSTYWGGEAQDEADGVAFDASGNVVITGQTNSTSFPLANAIQSTPGGQMDAFVTKLNSAGDSVIYSTYLGGTNWEFGSAVAIDASGNAYVTGLTTSTNFPTANPQATAGGCFVTKISPGGTLLYSTYVPSDSAGYDIAVDAAGNAYVTGRTTAFDHLTPINALQPVEGGNTDGFFVKLNPAGVFVLATYLGGSDYDGGYGIAVDAFGSAYITGETYSANFATAGALQPNRSGSSDAFVMKIGTASDLSLTMDTVSSVAAGTPLSYTFTVHNGGPAIATGVILHGLVPSGTSFVSVTSNQGSCVPPGPNSDYSCVLGTIAAGSSVVVTLKLSVTASNGATISVQASLTSDSDDVLVANNAAQQSTAVTHAPMISLNRNWLYFNTQTVGVNPPDQTFTLTNTGTGTLNWTAAAASNGGWLSVSPTSGIGNAVLTVSIAAGVKPIGTYIGTITINATGALNSPVLPVSFRVGQTITGPYTISTIAGVNAVVEGAQALTQPLSAAGMAVDSIGNIYFSGAGRNKIFKVSPAGVMTTFAGTGQATSAGDGGLATEAQLNSPVGIAVDSHDNVYFAEDPGYRVRRIDATSGIVTTIAGTGNFGSSGDGGPAALASLNDPDNVAVDGKGNVYINDAANYRIRRVAPNGTITTFAGTGTPGNGTINDDGSLATSVNIGFLARMVVDTTGNLYFTDNARVRKINSNGTITTVAGGTAGSCPSTGDNGPATVALLCSPLGLSIDAANNLYISEKYRVRKVTPEGIISAVAGTGSADSNGDSGPATASSFLNISAIAANAAGDFFVADTGKIRKITSSSGTIQRVAGIGADTFSGDDGTATSALFNRPSGIAADINGNIYIADTQNNRVRKVAPNGIVTTVAGNGTAGFDGDGGPATSGQLNMPLKVAVDTIGNLYITDFNNRRVRKVDTLGTVSTIFGDGSATFNPYAIAVDSSGDVFISELSRIWKIAVDGVVTAYAGNGTAGISGDDGPATTAQIRNVRSMAFDSGGNLYLGPGPFANPFVDVMRKVSPGGTISHVTAVIPGGVATGSADDLLVDRGCSVDRLVSGLFVALAGTSCSGGFYGDGGPALAAGFGSTDFATDLLGNIYSSQNSLVRKLTAVPDGSFTLRTSPVGIVLSAQSGLGTALAINLDGSGAANWMATKSAPSDWLTLSSTSGNGTASINVDANPAGLHGGFYSGYITITSPQAVNGSVVVPATLKVDYPSPTLTSLNPASVPIGSGATMVTLTGTNFDSGAKAQIGDTILDTTFVNSSQLTAVVPAGNLTSLGTYTIIVFNPAPGGGAASVLFNVIDQTAQKRRGQVTSQ